VLPVELPTPVELPDPVVPVELPEPALLVSPVDELPLPEVSPAPASELLPLLEVPDDVDPLLPVWPAAPDDCPDVDPLELPLPCPAATPATASDPAAINVPTTLRKLMFHAPGLASRAQAAAGREAARDRRARNLRVRVGPHPRPGEAPGGWAYRRW